MCYANSCAFLRPASCQVYIRPFQHVFCLSVRARYPGNTEEQNPTTLPVRCYRNGEREPQKDRQASYRWQPDSVMFHFADSGHSLWVPHGPVSRLCRVWWWRSSPSGSSWAVAHASSAEMVCQSLPGSLEAKVASGHYSPFSSGRLFLGVTLTPLGGNSTRKSDIICNAIP